MFSTIIIYKFLFFVPPGRICGVGIGDFEGARKSNPSLPKASPFTDNNPLFLFLSEDENQVGKKRVRARRQVEGHEESIEK